MDVALDVSAVPLTEEQIKTILDAREPRDGDIAVPTSIAFGEEKRLVPISSGEVKEYATAQEMIAAEPPLPDPVFKSGDVVPCTYDAGALLDKIDHHAEEFQELIKEMFEKGPVLKLTEEGMQQEVDNFMKIKNE